MRLVVPLTYPGGHYAPHASLSHTQEGTMRLMPPPYIPRRALCASCLLPTNLGGHYAPHVSLPLT